MHIPYETLPPGQQQDLSHQQQIHQQWAEVERMRQVMTDREAALRQEHQWLQQMSEQQRQQQDSQQREEMQTESADQTDRIRGAASLPAEARRWTLKLTNRDNNKRIDEGMIEIYMNAEMEVADVDPKGIEVQQIGRDFMFIGDETQFDHWMNQGQMEVDAEDGTEVTLEIRPCDHLGRSRRLESSVQERLDKITKFREEKRGRTGKFFAAWPVEIASAPDFRENFEQYEKEVKGTLKVFIQAVCPELESVDIAPVINTYTKKKKPESIVYITRKSTQSAEFSEHPLEEIRVVPINGSISGCTELKMHSGFRSKTGLKVCCHRREEVCDEEREDGRCMWVRDRKIRAGVPKRSREEDPELDAELDKMVEARRSELEDRRDEAGRIAQEKADRKVRDKHIKMCGPVCGDGIPTGLRCRFFEMGRCKRLGSEDGTPVCTSQGGHKGVEARSVYCGCSLKREEGGKRWSCSYEAGKSPYAFCSEEKFD